MTKYERLKQARESLGLTLVEFAKPLNRGSQWVWDIEKGKNWTKGEVLEKIERVHGISKHWLETGEGEMLLKEHARAENEPSIKGTIFPSLQRHGEKFAKQSDNLKILIVPVDNKNEEWVQVVPEYALASYSEWGFRDENFMRELPMETVPEDLRGKGTVRKFQVYGDSMEPTISHNDWIYGSYIQMTSEKEFRFKFRDNRIYIINSRTYSLLVKRLKWNPEDPTIVMAYSDNPDQSHYPPFPIPIDDITEWWYWRRTYTARGDRPETEMNRMLDEMRRMEQALIDLRKQVKGLLPE